VQRTKSGGGVEGNHWGRFMRWGGRRPWCAPCASLSGKKEKEGDGVCSTRRRARDGAPKEKKGGGVRYRDEGKNQEPTRVTGTEGYCATRRGEYGTTPWPHESGTRGPHHRQRPQGTQ
jgi:hypothetical protein